MFYEFFRIFGMVTGYPLHWLFFKQKVYYEDKSCTKYKKGGKVIISNHYNVMDYVLTAFMVFPRRLLPVAAEFAFRNKWTRHGMKFFGAIQANRKNRDMSFVDQAAEQIDKGRLVQIYPEAQNTPDGKMHEFKTSYVHIAARSNGKIQPIITDGNYGFFKRVHVMVGKEIDLADLVDVSQKELTQADVDRVNAIVYQKAQELRARLEELKAAKSRKRKR